MSGTWVILICSRLVRLRGNASLRSCEGSLHYTGGSRTRIFFEGRRFRDIDNMTRG